MTEDFKLLPCPFCGSCEQTHDNCDYGSGQWFICDGCGVTVKVPYSESLVDAWNRRASAPAPEVKKLSAIRTDMIHIAASLVTSRHSFSDDASDYKRQVPKWLLREFAAHDEQMRILGRRIKRSADALQAALNGRG